MHLKSTALAATVLAGLLYVAPAASALPAANRADIATPTSGAATEQVHYRRFGHHRFGYRRFGYRNYGYYDPYYYRPHRYYSDYGYYGYPRYYRRPGISLYFAF